MTCEATCIRMDAFVQAVIRSLGASPGELVDRIAAAGAGIFHMSDHTTTLQAARDSLAIAPPSGIRHIEGVRYDSGSQADPAEIVHVHRMAIARNFGYLCESLPVDGVTTADLVIGGNLVPETAIASMSGTRLSRWLAHPAIEIHDPVVLHACMHGPSDEAALVVTITSDLLEIAKEAA